MANGDFCSVEDLNIPSFNFDEEDLELCPNTKCWDVDFSRIGKLDPSELSDGKVITTDYFGSSRLEWAEGTKFLDRLLVVMNENLRIQYDNARILGDNYAETFIALMQTTLQLGCNMLIQSKELDLKAAQAQKQSELLDLQKLEAKIKLIGLRLQNEVLKEQIKKGVSDRRIAVEQGRLLKIQQENMREQTKLYERQKIGFNDNLFIKLFDAQMSNYAMIFSSGMLDDTILPQPLNANELLDVYKKFKEKAQVAPQEYAIDKRIVKPEGKFCL